MTSEAAITKFNPAMRPQNIAPPFVKTLSAGVAFTIYDRTQNQKLLEGALQNVGTNPVLYCYNDDCTATMYHGVLAGGSAAKDGLGSVLNLDFTKRNITKLSLYSVAGTDVVLSSFYDPSSVNIPA